MDTTTRIPIRRREPAAGPPQSEGGDSPANASLLDHVRRRHAVAREHASRAMSQEDVRRELELRAQRSAE